MARDLDRQAASGTEIRVYWLEHADAEKLLPVLQQLVGQATASPVTASTPAAGTPPSAAPAAASTVVAGSGGSGGNGISSRGPAIVTRYEGANAIIVAANRDRKSTRLNSSH